MQFDNHLKIKEALPIFFEQYHFKDGGYNDKYFKIKIGKFFLPVPNIKARVKGAQLHDIHHIITEFEANWAGEVKIGIWELRIGCKKSWTGWILNAGAVFVGLFLYQKAIKEGYLLARKTKTNLYHFTENYETLLEMTVGELKEKIFQSNIEK